MLFNVNHNEVILLSKDITGPIFSYSVFFSIKEKEERIEKIDFEIYFKLNYFKVPALCDNKLSDFTQLDVLILALENLDPHDSCL